MTRRPSQPALAVPPPPRAPQRPVERGSYELPPDYGEDTDWTPRPVPDELWIESIDGPRPGKTKANPVSGE